MKYKVELQITGTVEQIEDSAQQGLFPLNENPTEAQAYRLEKEGVPATVISFLTKELASKIIGAFEAQRSVRSFEEDDAMQPIQPLLAQFAEKKREVAQCFYCEAKPVSKGLCRRHYNEKYRKENK